MPYKTDADLPKAVKDSLPKHAREIWRKAYDSAYEEYSDPKKRRGKAGHEETAAKVAWSAVEKEYHKDSKGDWVEGGSR